MASPTQARQFIACEVGAQSITFVKQLITRFIIEDASNTTPQSITYPLNNIVLCN